ncbi:MAG: hypothetical protein JWR69_1218 [Pedosphaera sp.]|nr:hypothetical protein [Pedosphaera sp.]
MKMTCHRWLGVVCLWFLLLFAAAPRLAVADTLVWHKEKDRVDADIQNWDLVKLLENVAGTTGWHVFLEPDTAHKVSAKFNNLSTGEALRSLLGDLNFVVVPQTNAASRLYVFRTSRQNASRAIRAVARASAPAKPIPNELIVTLKPGSKTKIEDLARMLGAKIIGRMEGQNAYRLQFDDAAAAEAAREQLADNPDVQSVDFNYPVSAPPQATVVTGASAPELQLKPKPSDGSCQPLVIGMIDTTVQQTSPSLARFIKPSLSVVGKVVPPTAHMTHATAMAETILQSIQAKTGGNTSVTIQPVDVFGNNETTTTFDVANGAVTAVNNGANILNMSLGSGSDSKFLENTLSQISAQGIPIYAAAGNEPVTTPTYPAAYPGVVAVTASDRSGKIADYANHGNFIDMIAPGDSIVSFNGQNYLVEGTSTSTAFASGMAAGLADSAGACADRAQALLQSSLKPMASTKQ